MAKQTQQMTAKVEISVIGAGVLLSGHGFYLVPSESDPTRCYVVEQLPTRLGCTCKDHFFRGRRCKHIEAVIAHKALIELERAEARDSSAHTECVNGHESHAPPGRSRPGSSRATGVARDERDTAILRRNDRPFSLLK